MARLRKTGKQWRSADGASAGCLLEARSGYFMVEPKSLFSRAAPLEIEIGAGRGEFIIGRAAAMPQRNFLAVELSVTLAQLLAMRATEAGLDNLRVARMDARPLVNLFLPAECVSAYHIYFPDPWPKARHAKYRLFTPGFLGGLIRTMAPGATLYVATDVAGYAELIFSMIRASGLSPNGDRVAIDVTGFGRRFIAQGRTVYGRAFAK